MRSKRLIISMLVLLAVCECKNKTVSKWKINTYKSPDGEITMTMEDARKILTQMVNRYNGVSSPVRLTNLRGKPDYENKKSYIFEIKDKLVPKKFLLFVPKYSH